MTLRQFIKVTGLAFLMYIAGIYSPYAQETPPADTAADVAPASSPAVTNVPGLVAPDVPFDGSFLFSPAELALLARAQAGVVTGTAILNTKTVDPAKSRTIRLAGVIFRSEGDWIAWLNGRKIFPGNLLPEIVDIKVEKDKIKLKWFDAGLNGILSLELRPHQVYDIVTGVLLPG